MLRDVEARLSGLADRAAEARDRAAGTPVAGALDRIGSGMARLADDVSATQLALDEGWSRDDAEALTQLYEIDSHVQTQVPAAQPLPVAPRDPVRVAPAPAVPVFDRAWLDARLAEIATRVDAALAAADPQVHFTSLGTRLDQFEARFTAAVDALDRRPDEAAFHALEAQMSEIRSEVQATRRHVMRIDHIEERIDRLTELAEAAGVPGLAEETQATGSATAPIHVDALLARLSEQISDMRAATLAAAGSDPRFEAQAESLSELRRLLDASVADQKKSASETAALL
jgi:hypothetical protein